MKELIEVNGERLTTTSLLVADKFNKSHDFVIRKIENLKCSQKFHSVNFTESSYLAKNGKKEKSYLITEEGFAFIAMRFTGKEAVEWQEKFISAFQAMRKELNRLQKMRLAADWQEARENGKAVRSVMVSAVQALERLADKQGGEKGKPENRHYYETTTRMIYKELFGDGSLKKIRDKADALHLQFLAICESSCADEIQRLVELQVDYHDVYAECKKRVITTVNGLSASKLTSPNQNIRLVWDKTQ